MFLKLYKVSYLSFLLIEIARILCSKTIRLYVFVYEINWQTSSITNERNVEKIYYVFLSCNNAINSRNEVNACKYF